MDSSRLEIGVVLSRDSRQEFWESEVVHVFCSAPGFDRDGFGASTQFAISAFNVLADSKLFEVRNAEIELEDKSEVIFWGDADSADIPDLVANHILYLGSKIAFGIKLHGASANFSEFQDDFLKLRSSFWMDFGSLTTQQLSQIDAQLKARDRGYQAFCDFLAEPLSPEFQGPLEMMLNKGSFSLFFA